MLLKKGVMDCENCSLKYGPYPLLPNDKDYWQRVDTECKSIKLIRTEVTDYYVCHKSGMPKEPDGWYPGRGF